MLREPEIRISLAGKEDERICQEIERQVWAPYNWIAATEETIPGYFHELHLVALDPFGRIIGTIDGCPMEWDGDPESLPPNGWQGVNDQAIRGWDKAPRYATAIGASVLPEYRKFGVAQKLLEGLKKQALLVCGYEGLLAPVLPSAHWRTPEMPLSEYADLRLPDGRHFDPWVRTHERVGGRIIGTTDRSAVFMAQREAWEQLAGLALPDNGSILIDRASTPLELRDGIGTLIEGSIWLLHD